MKWLSKGKREDFEIKGFINAYCKLPHGRKFDIVRKEEKPDYVVRDIETGEQFGVELTSVYLNNRSVPDVHMRYHVDPVEIPYNREEIEVYKIRIIETILDKIKKAQKEYDTSLPLILSIYVNEYISIYMDDKEWQSLVNQYEDIFDAMSPFVEIVFWPLPNDGVFSVKPGR